MKLSKLFICAIFIFGSSACLSQDQAIAEDNDNTVTSEAESSISLTLYNFKLESDEKIENPKEMTVEKGKEFIPPLPVAEELYLSYIKQGFKPLKAITYTYVELRKAMAEVQDNS
jgi:hypothetical protein